MPIDQPAAVSPATPQVSPPSAGAEAQADTSSNGVITSDFDTFLQLLTAQLQNQDPLKPLESTEFVAQLAQFSAVEQQVRTNDALERIEAAVGGGGELTQWLGAEVRAPVATAFDGAPVGGRFEANPDAKSAVLVVEDVSGTRVSLSPVIPGASVVEWDGTTTSGADAPSGFYRLSVAETDASGALTETPVDVFARVAEARRDADGSVSLIFESGEASPAAAVTAVRAADDDM